MSETIDVQQFADRRKKIETIARMLSYAQRNTNTVEGCYAAVEVEDEIEANIEWIVQAAQAYYQTNSACCLCHRSLHEEAK